MALGRALVGALVAAAATPIVSAAPTCGGGGPHGPPPAPNAVQPAKTYAACQQRTADPLAGCPPGTIFVSQTPHAAAQYATIQGAIASLADDTAPATILIAPGTYREQLNVTRAGPLALLGTTDGPAAGRAYGGAATSDVSHANAVTVVWAAANGDNTGKLVDNAVTAVLTVAPTWEAALTGTGPTGYPVPASAPLGSADFRAYNIDFRNDAADKSVGPALAVGVARARAGFYGCGLYSYQDTVYVGKRGAAYFYDAVVAGEVDFLYGFGTAWVEKSLLALRGCGGGVAAWKGTNTTQPNHYGVYVARSRVLAANASVAATIAGTCPLGRPWNALHRSVYLDTYLDGSVLPAAYVRWQPTDPRTGNATLMALAGARGPGFDPAAVRAAGVGTLLDPARAAAYAAPARVFRGPGYAGGDDGEGGAGAEPDVAWIDQSVYPRP